MPLVLWDLDGTLVDTAPHGREAFAEAFERAVGRGPARVPSMSGRTDQEIALELLEQNGVEDGERALGAFVVAFAGALADREHAIRAEGRVLPGAREAIAALAGEPRVVQSLLTGNLERNARLKLALLDLEVGLELEVGGYGSDARERPRLVAAARSKGEAEVRRGGRGR